MVQQQSKLCENYAAPDYNELKAVFPFSYIEMLWPMYSHMQL